MALSKKEPSSKTRDSFQEPEISDHQHTPSPTHPWKAHFLRRLPYDALVAILLAIACIIFMVIITRKSNNDLIENWTVSPGVYLAITSVVANVVLRYTFSRGVEITWWVTALRDGTTVKDLHNVWSFGTSLQAALLAGRHFNWVALAAIVLTLVPANAPLAQRASQVVSRAVVSDIRIRVEALRAFGYNSATGYVTGRSAMPTNVTPTFASILQRHLLSSPIPITDSSCRGTCRGTLQAAGYQMTCVNGTEFFDKTLAGASADGGAAYNATAVFSTAFTYQPEFGATFAAGQAVLNLTTRHKTEGECKGWLAVRNCTLVPATLEYRVVVSNGSIALDSEYSYKDDKVVDYLETVTGNGAGPTVHGGMWLALSQMFDSMVTLRFAGPVGMEITTKGLTPLQFALQAGNASSSFMDTQCNSYWRDPTDNLLTTARDLIFRAALEGDLTGAEAQSIPMTQRASEVVYSSDFLFLGLALLLIGLSTVAVLPLLLQWWRLGRPVSLSPIEVARAFAAPELAGSGSNSDTSALMKEIGSKKIRYGAVDYSGQSGHVVATELAVANPGVVRPPQNGVSY